MSLVDHSSGKNYWIVTIQSTHTKSGVAGGDLITTSLASVVVHASGSFKPGKTLQSYAKSNVLVSAEEQETQYFILSVVPSSKEDVEEYGLDFEHRPLLIDLDAKTVSRSQDPSVGAEL